MTNDYDRLVDEIERLKMMGLAERGRAVRLEMELAQAQRALRERDEAREMLRQYELVMTQEDAEIVRDVQRIEAERDEALALLRDVARSGIEHDDPRVSYVTVQIDRLVWSAVLRQAKHAD